MSYLGLNEDAVLKLIEFTNQKGSSHFGLEDLPHFLRYIFSSLNMERTDNPHYFGYHLTYRDETDPFYVVVDAADYGSFNVEELYNIYTSLKHDEDVYRLTEIQSEVTYLIQYCYEVSRIIINNYRGI